MYKLSLTVPLHSLLIPEISIGIYQPFPTLFQLCIKLLSAINTLLM